MGKLEEKRPGHRLARVHECHRTIRQLKDSLGVRNHLGLPLTSVVDEPTIHIFRRSVADVVPHLLRCSTHAPFSKMCGQVRRVDGPECLGQTQPVAVRNVRGVHSHTNQLDSSWGLPKLNAVTRRGTHGCRRPRVGEPHPALGQRIQPRRPVKVARRFWHSWNHFHRCPVPRLVVHQHNDKVWRGFLTHVLIRSTRRTKNNPQPPHVHPHGSDDSMGGRLSTGATRGKGLAKGFTRPTPSGTTLWEESI